MSITEPQPTTTQQPSLDPDSRQRLIRNISLGALVLCPALIALPPRKLDIYTVGLVGGTFWASNNLAREYTGRSLVTRAQDRMRDAGQGGRLPPKAQEVQRRLREERIQREVADRLEALGSDERTREGVLEEVRRREDREERRRNRGFVQRIWLGGEDEDWKAKRDQREKEALERGEGYGGLIMEQIREVFGWGRGKVEEVKEVDEEIVKERRGGKE